MSVLSHTPPVAAPTNSVSCMPGIPTTSPMRPLMVAGPMERAAMAEKATVSGFGAGRRRPNIWAEAEAGNEARTRARVSVRGFIRGSLEVP